MSFEKGKVCPWWLYPLLDNPIRRWFNSADSILGEYLQEGMSFLDLGCGGGRYAIGGARLVGEQGRVVALDIQQKMLDMVEQKVAAEGLAGVVELHLAEQDSLNLKEEFDFILAMCMVHETPDYTEFFRQVKAVLKLKGRMLVVEPIFHVSQKTIQIEVEAAKSVGLKYVEEKKINMFLRGYLLERSES